jgi:hypothetical protein
MPTLSILGADSIVEYKPLAATVSRAARKDVAMMADNP